MSIITVLLAISILGFISWLILQIPMPEPIRKIAIGVLCVLFIVWFLQALGVVTGLPTMRLR